MQSHSVPSQSVQKTRRLLAIMRRIFHVKGDVMCTVLLLVLLCILLYAQQVLVSLRWDRTTLKLEMQGSTSSSRALLGADGKTETVIGARISQKSQGVPSGPPDPKLPSCKPQEPKSQSKHGAPQSKSSLQVKPDQSSKAKVKGGHKNVVPTTMSENALPTMAPFDFEGYLREKDNRNFRLLIDQPQKCKIEGGEGEKSSPTALYLLIAVKSAAEDFDKRQVVRQTWGKEGVFQYGATTRTVFLLGVPRNERALPLWDRLLAYESETFKDILLWDFEDTFFNLTLKETHFLQWVNTSCPYVRFIFKGDADVFVNVENILEMLHGEREDEDLFIGDIIIHAKPIRRRSSKYYVPEFMYGAGLYPSYAGGGGFVMSGHTARRLSSACQKVELFPIDDVFLGMCLQHIGIKLSRHKGFRTFGIPQPSAAPHLQMFDPCFYRELMVVHSLTVPQIWLMWHLLHDHKLICHNRRSPTPWPFKWKGRLEGNVETQEDTGEEEILMPDMAFLLKSDLFL
ncbi:UDP-GlcNAc:betaGal beta-1,3-N-acetylglucosaminyltransferase 9 [Lampris incognitus]|uniref:UDP-GlcNAc:betaGal beta-1,3-N-acetylglucosaminyltransferase 9 n=1 Tax=Lampris incognitus TaxID=2546036 RepID=UPI0024B50B93|nr:UDP-GlcNAc:betaGal beta-1,3-N-acetylglucosaminyltransferase 9 [Lampris incognitus]XP_056137612.1 UDP-GlcNAc:betaGal beta-1,3-N-acetylglucosaminyltransferase 9 [Lampris incognitus]